MSRSLMSLMIAMVFAGCTPDTDQSSPASRSSSDRMQIVPGSFKILRPATTDGLMWDVLEVMSEHSNFYEGEHEYRRSTGAATKGQLAVYACTWYLNEVNNGGHNQFFSNSTGLVWEDALKGFRLLNAPEHLEIITQAVAVFPESRPSKDRQERWAQLKDADTSTFDSLDTQLYGLEENFYALATKYILENPDEFFVEP